MLSNIKDSWPISILTWNNDICLKNCIISWKEKKGSCANCAVKKWIIEEISNNFSIGDNVQKLLKWKNELVKKLITKWPEKIKDQLYNELLNSLNNADDNFNITNLDTQFSLLTLLGLSTEEKNKIYQDEISDFFSLILKFQKSLDINIDILWEEFNRETLINSIKLMKNIWFTDFNMYITNWINSDMIVKKIDISCNVSSIKIKDWKNHVSIFTTNIRNLLEWKENKVSNNFNYKYSNIPVPWVGEDIGMLLNFKKEWLKIVFWFDHIHKAVDVKSIPIIENIINTIDNKFSIYFSNRDDLTWLLRRDNFLEKIWRKNSWTFIIFDIDDFKSINDNYWHNIWDEVIKKVAAALKFNTKLDKDVVCRWWWEEFIIFLNEVKDKNTIQWVFNRIREYMQKIKIPELKWKKVTLSAWAYITDTIKKGNIIEMIWYADEKLYTSKETGKNKITI